MTSGDGVTCCAGPHPFDRVNVRGYWWPEPLRCFIIGESPGVPGADYFYDAIPVAPRDPVEVRRYLLDALADIHVIRSPTLDAFRDAGFVFDHAIRCQLSGEVMLQERKLARHFRSLRAHRADHLGPLIEAAPKVWVMGAVARDAVAHVCGIPPRAFQRRLEPPSVPVDYPKFFVSRYLNRHARVASIVVDFECFLGERPLRGGGA